MVVGRKAMVILVAQAVSAVLGAVALAFIGRLVAPQQMGMVAYSLGLAGLAAGFAQAGLSQAHIKKAHEAHLLDACHGALFWLRTRIGVAIFGAALVIFIVWDRWRGFQDTTLPLLGLALAYQFVLLQRSIFVTSFNAWQHTARAQMVPLADALTRAPAVVVVTTLLAANRLENATQWISGTYLFGAIIGLLLSIRWFKAAGFAIGKSTPELRREYLQFGIPLAMSGIIAQWLLQLDTVMIGFFGNAADVGSYFAASRIIKMILIFPGALGLLLLPSFIQLLSRGDNARAEAGRVIRQISIVMLPGLVLLIMYPTEVLQIAVGGRYTNAAPALRWLAVYAILATLRVIPITIAKARNQPRLVLHASLINLGANVVLNTALIPKSLLGYKMAGLGIEGAAIATLCAQAIALTYVSWRQREHIRWNLLGAMAVTAAASLVWLRVPLAWFESPERIWSLAIIGLGFYAVCWLIMRAFGTLTREDVAHATDAIHPRKLLHYIRDELRFRPPS
jgi:O-antigen/teichoic acid export membrane protein